MLIFFAPYMPPLYAKYCAEQRDKIIYFQQDTSLEIDNFALLAHVLGQKLCPKESLKSCGHFGYTFKSIRAS